MLPGKAVGVLSLEVFKTRLEPDLVQAVPAQEGWN